MSRKAYWIARVDVSGDAGYRSYSDAVQAILEKHRGRFIVRGGAFECMEGESRSRNVVVEFPDYATAMTCYRSPEYQDILKIRQANAITDLIVVEGSEEP